MTGGVVGAAAPNPWARLRQRVLGASGWRRYALAVVLGVLAAGALPPLHIVPLLPIAFTGIFWLTAASRTPRAAFAAGWWFGLGHFIAGLYWIAHALLTDPERFGWMIPFAVGGLAAVIAVYIGLATLIAWVARARGVAGILFFAAIWTTLEWLRGVLFTGFPWNLIGTVWVWSNEIIQLAAVTGVWGLSALTVAVAAMPATVTRGSNEWRAPAVALVFLALVWAGGAIRLSGATEATVPGAALRIVQPNISQVAKWRDELRAQHLARHIRLSEQNGDGAARIVVWPESAVPYVLANEPVLLDAVARAVPAGGLVITGSLRTTPQRTTPFQIWNSLHAVDGRGEVVATYDKFHLVPFGEYVPFRRFINIPKITHGSIDFSAGPGPQTVALPGFPAMSPLVCYEVIFPGAVTDPNARPGWLLNVTNDGWFGVSSGPYQHFAAARLRAVEEGLPLVRAANTGISAVVDSHGRVTARLGLDREGVVDASLPVALAGPTPYARWGDWIGFVIIILMAAPGVLIRIARPPIKH